MAFRGLLQLLVVVLCRTRHDLGQGGDFRAIVRTSAFVFRHLQADAVRQFLDRVDEAETGILHEKADGRTVRPATEAMVELLRRTDGERRRFLVMERAAGGKVGTRLLERDVAVDQVDDVDAVQ